MYYAFWNLPPLHSNSNTIANYLIMIFDIRLRIRLFPTNQIKPSYLMKIICITKLNNQIDRKI